MASAVLLSQNGPSWGGFPNAVTEVTTKTHRNPKLYSRKHVRQNPVSDLHVNVTHSVPHFATDTALLKPLPTDANQKLDTTRVRHVTFNLSTYSKRDRNDLKNRLVSELRQVRILQTRIQHRNFSNRFNCPNPSPAHPPPPVRQVAKAANAQLAIRNNNPKGKKRGEGREAKRGNPFADSGKKQKKIAAAEPNAMKKCREILGKLMKYKHGWVFNTPVDVVGLGLHDYNIVVKTPMDLGTVKSNLDKNSYRSPLEFAEDVRLTFNNALRYNPVGHHVHTVAATLLTKFEELFNGVVKKMEDNRENVGSVGVKLSRPKVRETVMKRREMSKEEKKNLGSSLMDLPEEKLVEVFDILNKRNNNLDREDDQFVLDIESLDEETLWELDGLVSNTIKASAEKSEVGDEDVDIGDEIPAEAYPPVEIERDVNVTDNTSSSSSGSSDDDDSSSSSSSRGKLILIIINSSCFINV